MKVRWRRNNNVFLDIRNRECGSKSYYRANLMILRRFFSDDGRCFKHFWKISSKNGIHFERFHVLTNHLRSSYTLNTYSSPHLCFDKQNGLAARGRIEHCLISQCPVENMNMFSPASRQQFSSYSVTSDNWLIHFDVRSGELLHELYLLNEYKFKSIAWDVVEDRFYLSSTKRKIDKDNPGVPFMSLQIFSVWPFTYHGLFEAQPSVFGCDMTDIMLSNNILVVSYHNSKVRLYNFQLELYHISSEEMKLSNSLSSKIKLNKSPEILMEISALDCFLSIGGIPWHYLVLSKSNSNQCEVRSLQTHKICQNGILGTSALQLEQDRCFFHPDESGKIVLVGSDFVTMLKISTESVNKLLTYKLDELFQIKSHIDELNINSRIQHSSSGREIKPVRKTGALQEGFYRKVQCVSFEDELDMVVVTTLEQKSTHGGWFGSVNFYDNQCGELITSYDLTENWNPDEEHEVELDLDTLYHYSKSSGMCRLYVHRLQKINT